MADFLGLDFVWWQGVVEENTDPLKLGRCKVRIAGWHTSEKRLIPTEDLPWAYPVQPINSAAISGIGISPTGILNGTWVFGFFRDGKDAQQPMILGTLGGIPQHDPVEGLGFNDPDLVYPKKDMIGEPDTNRLAVNGATVHPVIATKDASADSATAGFNSTWQEPKSPYNATYPQNHVRETESGHIQEFDDTPGAERIHTYHKSGTFTEIHPDGSEVHRVVGKNYEIFFSDNNVHVKGKCNLTVDGDANVKIGGNANLQVDGNHKEVVNGTYEITSLGAMTIIAPTIDLNP